LTHLAGKLGYKPEGHVLDSRCFHWNPSWTQIFRTLYGPGIYSASNRNKYQEYFMGVNAAGA